MNEIERATTPPSEPVPTTVPPHDTPPPTAPKSASSRGRGALRYVVVAALAFAIGLSSGRLDLPRLVAGLRDSGAGASAARTAATAPNGAAEAAIKAVIERADRSQAQAFAQSDTTLMRDTATAAYYDELVQTNRALAAGGVRTIELTKLEWGAVSVDRGTARATSYETWRSRYADGSSEERTDRNDYTLVLEGGVWKIESDVQPDAQLIQPAPATEPQSQPGTPAVAASRSGNWSGYVASGGTFTSVSGSWIVPQVSAGSAGADATWVGIGGLRSGDLIQAGTQASVSGAGGVRYSAWIEMLPAGSRTVPLGVSAGDAVTVSLAQEPNGEWAIRMKNDTTGDSYGITVRYASSNSSAEWIQEAPSAGRGIVPLDAFGTLRFTGGSAARDGKRMSLRELGARAVSMINRAGEVLAQPSTLGDDGSSFTVMRTQASITTGNPGNPLRRRGGGP